MVSTNDFNQFTKVNKDMKIIKIIQIRHTVSDLYTSKYPTEAQNGKSELSKRCYRGHSYSSARHRFCVAVSSSAVSSGSFSFCI